jgi:hypothetical protein
MFDTISIFLLYVVNVGLASDLHPPTYNIDRGAVAQLGERHVRNV